MGRGDGDVRGPDGRGVDRGRVDRDVPGEDRQLQAAEGDALRGDGGAAAEHVGEDTEACAGEAVGVGGYLFSLEPPRPFSSVMVGEGRP